MSSRTVRTLSALPAFTDCGPYQSPASLGMTCDDVRATSRVIEVQLDGRGALVLVKPEADDDVTWRQYVSAARDRHEQNMEVYKDEKTGQVMMRTLRRVEEGEELFAWFEDSLARDLDIPALTPNHIRGKDQYVCTQCGAVFQRPNPLKSHIRYHCSTPSQNTSTTSSRPLLLPSFPNPLHLPPPIAALMSSASNLRGFPSPLVSPFIALNYSDSWRGSSFRSDHSAPAVDDVTSQTTPADYYATQRSSGERTALALDYFRHLIQLQLSTAAVQNAFQTAVSPFAAISPHYRSGFPPHLFPGAAIPDLNLRDVKPVSDDVSDYVKCSNNSAKESPRQLENVSKTENASRSPGHRSVVPNDGIIPSHRLHPHSQQLPQPRLPISLSANRQPMCDYEAMTAPMTYTGGGKSRGYMCLYCGKLYSRKYGLKIHVRTHTGFKPLQCRVCRRPFGDPSNLNKHVRLHAEGAINTPYRCRHCGKVLVRRRDLERHVRSRHPGQLEDASGSHAAVTSSVYVSDDEDRSSAIDVVGTQMTP